ncbi:MAG: DUF4395 domain-containing protein [Proteobacteria bacterium]|nr:DUF4395 domain-containing protein [Pseudomonadota bacterium]
MNVFLNFGEQLPEYNVRVLNEREVRASAGILFFFAMIAFMNAWLTGNFRLTKIFVIVFLIDFAIRIFVNPKYSPSIIVGRFAVRHQVPEYVGAPQKRFAWSIGFALAVAMLFLVVINNVIGPINLIICSTCLLLLFFEAAFGICLACKIYNYFHKGKSQLCPGGTCEIFPRPEVLKIGYAQAAVVILFLMTITAVGRLLSTEPPTAGTITDSAAATSAQAQDTADNPDCTVPDWAKAMGHKDQWKLHHNCK